MSRLGSNLNNSELAPPKPPSQSNSTFRPVSSIYSQPSPAPLITTFAPKSYTSPTSPPYSSPYGYGEDVSPPSSPEFDARQRYVKFKEGPREEFPAVRSLMIYWLSTATNPNTDGYTISAN
jgi:hypothetical protein